MDINDFVSIWINETDSYLQERASELIDYLKSNCNTYGELIKELSIIKKIVAYEIDFKYLESVIEMVLDVVENEKNTIPINKIEN